MRTDYVSFVNRRGYTLAGLLDRPEGRPSRAYALFAHCFTCGKDLKPFVHLNRALTAAGIAVLRFDFSGLGKSEGDFSDSNLSSNETDLIDAAEFLASHHQAPQIAIGHSMGGAAVVRSAKHMPSVRAIVTIATPADPNHLGEKLERARDEAMARGDAAVRIGGQDFTLKRQFFENLQESAMKRDLFDLDRALLVLHSPVDESVGIDNAARIFQYARHPKSFVALTGADHLMLDPDVAQYAGEVIAAWAAPYLTK